MFILVEHIEQSETDHLVELIDSGAQSIVVLRRLRTTAHAIVIVIAIWIAQCIVI